MIIALLIGAALGFVLAMPPGPVGVTAIRYGLQDSVKEGTYLSMGTALMDMMYCAAVIYATSAVVDSFKAFSNNHPYILLLIQLIVIAAFVLYGILNLKAKDQEFTNEGDVEHTKTSRMIQNMMMKGPFLVGVAIALTNIPNPTFLPSLAGVTMFVHQSELIENTILTNTIFAVGFGLGNFSWLYLLIRVISHYKSRMSANMITRIRQFAGISLIGFGSILGFRVVSVTPWHDLLRFAFVF